MLEFLLSKIEITKITASYLKYVSDDNCELQLGFWEYEDPRFYTNNANGP